MQLVLQVLNKELVVACRVIHVQILRVEHTGLHIIVLQIIIVFVILMGLMMGRERVTVTMWGQGIIFIILPVIHLALFHPHPHLPVVMSIGTVVVVETLIALAPDKVAVLLKCVHGKGP
jgi:hypothetical protein